MINEEEIQGSQSEDEEIKGVQDEDMDEIMSMFDIEKKSEVPTPPPAKEEAKAEPKMMKVKHNKEEIEVDVSDEKLPEYVQKALALDKEREKKTEYEKALDRVAKQQGYKDHSDLIANLDKIEQDAQKQKEDEYARLEADLIQEYEDAGGDPEKLKSWLNNNPLLQKARADAEAAKEREATEQQTKDEQEWNSKWDALYKKYPELRADADSNTFTFYTDEMKSRVDRGYDPIDAYELAHRDKIQAQNKSKTEQRIIKEQQLGLRSKVETNSPADNEPQVPTALSSAFAAFGLPADAAKKYVKK